MNEMRDTDKLIIQEQGYESGGSSNGTATTCTLRESPNTTEWGERKSSNIQYIVILREGTGTEGDGTSLRFVKLNLVLYLRSGNCLKVRE